jgi:hypothetical protein
MRALFFGSRKSHGSTFFWKRGFSTQKNGMFASVARDQQHIVCSHMQHGPLVHTRQIIVVLTFYEGLEEQQGGRVSPHHNAGTIPTTTDIASAFF